MKTEHDVTVPVVGVARDLIDQARGHHSGRAARTVASGTALRATVIALRRGCGLANHESPAAGATLHVITGRVRLHTDDHEWFLQAGELVPLPPQRHGLDALDDTALLLTVALR
jgi:quercetin dioxygenase-like cupin family protein